MKSKEKKNYLFGLSTTLNNNILMLQSGAPQVDLKIFSFLIKKKIAKNSKKQFRNAHGMVITARIISYNLKVDWNLQNKCQSRLVDHGLIWKIALVIFVQPLYSPLQIEYLKVEHNIVMLLYCYMLLHYIRHCKKTLYLNGNNYMKMLQLKGLKMNQLFFFVW